MAVLNIVREEERIVKLHGLKGHKPCPLDEGHTAHRDNAPHRPPIAYNHSAATPDRQKQRDRLAILPPVTHGFKSIHNILHEQHE